MKEYYVYIITNRVKTLYIGVTNNLVRRMYEHKKGMIEGFSKKIQLNKIGLLRNIYRYTRSN